MLETVRTALVIAPHPDDEVLGVGGTIARLAAQGSQVHVAILTRGTSPRFSEEFAERVRREAADAHRLLGVRGSVGLIRLKGDEEDTNVFRAAGGISLGF